jgi:hypothetical protein
MRNVGHVVSNIMILEHVWDYHFDPQANVVDVLVCCLRALHPATCAADSPPPLAPGLGTARHKVTLDPAGYYQINRNNPGWITE